jgi:hypothetical protein
MNPRIVIVVYKPLPGKGRDLEKVVAKHLDVLKSEKLVTDRKPIVMRASDGSIVEVFEWLSSKAIEAAHKNPQVLQLWDEFNLACTYGKPVDVEEFHNLFSEFEPLNLK